MRFKDCPINVPFTLPENVMAAGRTFVLRKRDPATTVQGVEDDQGEKWVVGPDEPIKIVKGPSDEDDIMP